MEQTKATENLSQWFNLAEQKPWEPGVYEVQRQDYDYVGQFSLFKNGKFHEVGVVGPNSAIHWARNSGVGDGCDVVKWRGLSSDPSAKPKPKARGNRRVTRYVVMVGYGIQSTFPAATFESKENAMAYIAHEAKSGRYETIYLDEIRFRTPEAD